jgi:gephyrin
MGELDLMRGLVEVAGEVHFGRLLLKPGKPCTFATVIAPNGAKRLVFGLPGNPVSSLVTFYLLVLPAIQRMAGRPNPGLRRVQAALAAPLRLDPARPEYHRAHVQWETTLHGGAGGWLAQSTGNQASSRLLSMYGANALLELPQAEGELAAGSIVPALLIE